MPITGYIVNGEIHGQGSDARTAVLVPHTAALVPHTAADQTVKVSGQCIMLREPPVQGM